MKVKFSTEKFFINIGIKNNHVLLYDTETKNIVRDDAFDKFKSDFFAVYGEYTSRRANELGRNPAMALEFADRSFEGNVVLAEQAIAKRIQEFLGKGGEFGIESIENYLDQKNA